MAEIDYQSLLVLVVEDHDMIRDIVTSILRTIGFRKIRGASNGQNALRIVTDEHPDLIICDITMDVMDGFQFVEAAHKLADTAQRMGLSTEKRIPTIFLTAHANAEFVARAKQLGVDAYVIKPVKRDVLEARIRHVLTHRLDGK